MIQLYTIEQKGDFHEASAYSSTPLFIHSPFIRVKIFSFVISNLTLIFVEIHRNGRKEKI